MQSLFKRQPEMPPLLVVFMVVVVAIFIVLPGLHLGPLGMVVGGVISVTVAFAMGRRVETMQAQRRALAAASSAP
jgi:Na+/H+-translocating membrane pyrophosphatase